jgi:hypothetical protein
MGHLCTASELLYDWRFTASQFVLVTDPLRLTTTNFIFQLITCGYSPYETSSLTRRWVWRLQLLLVLASAVILRFESVGLTTIFYFSDMRLPQHEGPGPRFYIPRNRVAGYTPRHWVPFSSPATTRRVTVEVFKPTCTRDHDPTISQLVITSRARTAQKTSFLYCSSIVA